MQFQLLPSSYVKVWRTSSRIQGFAFREALRLGYGDPGSVDSGLSGALVGERKVNSKLAFRKRRIFSDGVTTAYIPARPSVLRSDAPSALDQE